MQWDDLEVFIVVAELGNFTRAAERLVLSKSSVSRSISLLEERLGERLMERSTRRLRLTEAGLELFQQVRPVFSLLHDILNQRESLHGSPRGVLRIAAPYEFSMLTLSEVLPDVLLAFPDLEATLDLAAHPADPLSGGYDIVFVQSIAPLPDSSLVAKRIVEIPLALYAAPELVRKMGLPDGPDDLLGWPMVSSRSNQTWKLAHRASGEVYTLPVHACLATPSVQMRLRAAQRGLGIALLPTTFCKEAEEQGLLLRILPDYDPVPLTIYALIPSRKMIAPRVKVLLDAIATKFDGMAGLI